jgi:hypothetical protein
MSSSFGNSGVFIRVPKADATERESIHQGIEIQIDETDDDWHSTGVLYSMTRAKARPVNPHGEWNTMEITLDGDRTMVILNGTLVTDYDGDDFVPGRRRNYEPTRGPRPAEGYIAIQNHDDRSTITFKEISIRPLR